MSGHVMCSMLLYNVLLEEIISNGGPPPSSLPMSVGREKEAVILGQEEPPWGEL